MVAFEITDFDPWKSHPYPTDQWVSPLRPQNVTSNAPRNVGPKLANRRILGWPPALLMGRCCCGPALHFIEIQNKRSRVRH